MWGATWAGRRHGRARSMWELRPGQSGWCTGGRDSEAGLLSGSEQLVQGLPEEHGGVAGSFQQRTICSYVDFRSISVLTVRRTRGERAWGEEATLEVAKLVQMRQDGILD